jgi:hypothetical protein
MKRFKWLTDTLIVTALCIGAAELTLRAQQHFGDKPLYDLASPIEVEAGYGNVSDPTLNHRSASQNKITLLGSTYGEHAGTNYVETYDITGVKQPVGNSDCSTSVLFLGDSFMQGYDNENTIPYQVAKFLKEDHDICIKYYNAGATSYSPSIFVPLAKRLMPLLKPNYVIVDVDETDVFDDNERYAGLIERGDDGGIIAVRPSPRTTEFGRRLAESRRHLFYLHRLAAKVWLTRLDKSRERPGNPFTISWDKTGHAETTYASQLGVFRRNLQELCEVLTKGLAERDHMIFISHPHRRHLRSGDTEPPLWNRVISNTVEQVATANGGLFYNTTDALDRVFNGAPEQYYWIKDMHLNFRGIEEHSRAAANYLADKIKTSSYRAEENGHGNKD